MSNLVKIDYGKPDLSRVLDAKYALGGLADALKFGESKDGRTRLSWKNYNDNDGLMSAALRHLMIWQNGEVIDPDSGLNHLAHALTNIVMLYETNPGLPGETITGEENDQENRSRRNNDPSFRIDTGEGDFTVIHEPRKPTGAGKRRD